MMRKNNNALISDRAENQGNLSLVVEDKDKQKSEIIRGLNSDFNTFFKNKKFPIDIFPEKITELLIQLKNTMNFPVDYLGSSILYATSVAIGNNIQLKVKNNWIEKSILFIVLVGRTGDVKSHTISFFIDDLIKIDQQNFKEYLKQKKEFENLNSDEAADKTVPILKQVILNDFTPEALIKSHYFNSRGIGLYSDEIAGFFKSFNRYHRGTGDEELYLSLWAGKPVVKNRITGDELRIDNTKIDIIGTIQEAILGETFRNSKMKNGFIDRLLFAFPSHYVDNKWNDSELNQAYIDWYSDFITSIFHEADKRQVLLEFEDEAKKFLYNWQNSQKMLFDFEYQRGIAVKLQQYVLRFSIVLEVMSCFCEGKPVSRIRKKTVMSAIKLQDYFFDTAIQVFESIESNYFEGLTEVQKKVFEILPNSFKTKEAVEIVLKHELLKERSLKSFLKDKKLFKKISYGIYEKVIV